MYVNERTQRLQHLSMKFVESLVMMNIARYTGLRLGMEAKSRALVLFVVLGLGVKFSYVVNVGEKEKETVLITI